MSAAATVIAAQAAQRRKLVRHFVSHGAVSAEHAIAKDTLPRSGSRALEHLQRQRIVCTDPAGMLYLDERRLHEVEQARHATLAKVLIVVALALLVAAVVGILAAA